MGQTYVDITATEIEDGIMTIAASGGGQETGSAWLYWTDNGFTGQGWYWNDPLCGVRAGWEAAVIKDHGHVNGCKGEVDGSPHDDSYESFIYHISQRHSENLSYILSGWEPREKTYFIVYNSELEDAGCVIWQ